MASPDEVAVTLCKARGLAYVRFAGGGAFKRTYRVQLSDATDAALKLYTHDTQDERSDRETEAMLKCSSPYIARLFEISSFVHEGRTHKYTLEEFVAGGTLTERIAQYGHFSVPALKRLARPLVAALEHIASNELVHRDLKPDNIMLREDGETPVVVDFGLVRTLNEVSLTPTWLQAGPGTPWFSPPEQLNNEKLMIDWRADQFSLGIVLAQCISNDHPYSLEGDSPAQTVSRVATRGSVDARFRETTVRLGLEPILRMISPWPVQRYRTPDELARAWE